MKAFRLGEGRLSEIARLHAQVLDSAAEPAATVIKMIRGGPVRCWHGSDADWPSDVEYLQAGLSLRGAWQAD